MLIPSMVPTANLGTPELMKYGLYLLVGHDFILPETHDREKKTISH